MLAAPPENKFGQGKTISRSAPSPEASLGAERGQYFSGSGLRNHHYCTGWQSHMPGAGVATPAAIERLVRVAAGGLVPESGTSTQVLSSG